MIFTCFIVQISLSFKWDGFSVLKRVNKNVIDEHDTMLATVLFVGNSQWFGNGQLQHLPDMSVLDVIMNNYL